MSEPRIETKLNNFVVNENYEQRRQRLIEFAKSKDSQLRRADETHIKLQN